jgi:5-methylcytosine-specific restriction protein A
MNTFLLTWNPQKWRWSTLNEDLNTFLARGLLEMTWSCGNRKAIYPGDRVFLLKQGKEEPRGLFASGYVTSAAREGQHFTDPDRTAIYVDIDFDVLLDPSRDVFPRARLDRRPFAAVNWSTQSGGIAIAPAVAPELESQWDEHVRLHGLDPIRPGCERGMAINLYAEGRRRTVPTSRLERSASARRACIQAQGCRCLVCDVDFGERYGDMGRGYIHVHHQELLAGPRGERHTNPLDDLVPVCPNCHAMLHHENPPLTVAELRRRMRR